MTAVVAGRKSLLGAIWDYHHEPSGEWVLNVEGLCRNVMLSSAEAWRQMSQQDYDEALSHLLGEVVIIADGYRPRDSHSVLAGYMKWKLGKALIDYLERTYGGAAVFANGVVRPMGWKRVVDLRPLERELRETIAAAGWVLEQRDPLEEQDDETLAERLAGRRAELVRGPDDLSFHIEEAMGDVLRDMADEQTRANEAKARAKAQDQGTYTSDWVYDDTHNAGRRRSRNDYLEGLAEFVDWGMLPDKHRRDLRRMVPMLIAGFKNREIAVYYGRSEDWVAERIRSLKIVMRDMVMEDPPEPIAELLAA